LSQEDAERYRDQAGDGDGDAFAGGMGLHRGGA
jgi:hypothetical protein